MMNNKKALHSNNAALILVALIVVVALSDMAMGATSLRGMATGGDGSAEEAGGAGLDSHTDDDGSNKMITSAEQTDASSYSSSSTTAHQASRRKLLSPSPQRITYDNFESGWGTFTDLEFATDPKSAIRVTSTNQPNQSQYIPDGSAALRIRGNLGEDSSVFQQTSYDVSPYDLLHVQFDYMMRNMGNADSFVIEYSSSSKAGNENNVWTTVEEFIWVQNDVKQSGVASFFKSAGTDHARIRFRCIGSTTQQYVYIDNVEFSGQ